MNNIRIIKKYPNGGNSKDTTVSGKVTKAKTKEFVQSFTDPYTGKQFYVVEPSTENIKRTDTFPFDKTASGKVLYGTYTKPNTAISPKEGSYIKTAYTENYEDPSKSGFSFSNENLRKLYNKQNPYNRTALVDSALLNIPTNKGKKELDEKTLTAGLYESTKEYSKGGTHWIQKAVNPKHKGYCTPMTKSTCTPHRKALAMTFKKHHGFHEDGGYQYTTEETPFAKYTPQPLNFDVLMSGIDKLNKFKSKKGVDAKDEPKATPLSRDNESNIADYNTFANSPISKGGLKFNFATGGTSYSVPSNNPNAELEKGEPFMLPNGDIYKVSNNAPSHSDGGVQMNLPEGTAILGKLKEPYTNKEYKQLGDKLYKQYSKYTKILENKPTGISKKTAELMLNKTQKQYLNLMQSQESQKPQEQDYSSFANGGIQKYKLGSWLKKNAKYAIPVYGTAMLAKDTAQSAAENYTDTQNAPNDILEQVSKLPVTEYDKFSYDDSANNVGDFSFNSGTGYQWKNVNAQQLNANDYYNPYEKETLSTLKNLKYDYNANPELAANKNAAAVNYANLRSMGASAGRSRAGLAAAQLSRMRADSQVLANKQNLEQQYNNQYKTNYANTLGQMGQQRANTALNVNQYNVSNKLSADTTNRQGAMSAYNQNYQNQLAAYNTRVQNQQNKFSNALSAFNANFNVAQANEAAKLAPYMLQYQAAMGRAGTQQANVQTAMNAVGMLGNIGGLFI